MRSSVSWPSSPLQASLSGRFFLCGVSWQIQSYSFLFHILGKGKDFSFHPSQKSLEFDFPRSDWASLLSLNQSLGLGEWVTLIGFGQCCAPGAESVDHVSDHKDLV